MDVEICAGQEGKSYAMGRVHDCDDVMKKIIREVGQDRCNVTVEVKYLEKIISFEGQNII